MRRPALLILVLAATAAVAGCAGESGASPAAVDTAPPATPAPASEAADPGTAGGGCQPSDATPTVTVTIADFSFGPPAIEAAVGDVIGFTNSGSAPHTATLDEGDCTTPTLEDGASAALTFDAPGEYPYHCRIHSAMTGTITITE